MSAEARASRSVVTLSPSESRVAAMHSRLTRSHAASTSSTVIPATKRPESFRPIDERSENARKLLFRESAINADRSKSYTSVSAQGHRDIVSCSRPDRRGQRLCLMRHWKHPQHEKLQPTAFAR